MLSVVSWYEEDIFLLDQFAGNTSSLPGDNILPDDVGDHRENSNW